MCNALDRSDPSANLPHLTPKQRYHGLCEENFQENA
jgi:hypothetical protein